jgi:hypothetical protein
MAIVPVTRKRGKMAPYGGKGGVLHLSYLRYEFDDPNFFFRFYHEHIINFTPAWEVSANSHFQNNY